MTLDQFNTEPFPKRKKPAMDIGNRFKPGTEWGDAARDAETAARKLMAEVDTPEALIETICAKKFAKYIYPMAAWVEDSARRRAVGTAFVIHCWGVKLLDDIIDDDTGYRHPDLAVAGIRLYEHAASILASQELSDAFFRLSRAKLPAIWRHLKKEPDTTLTSLEEWDASSRVKCGHIMAFYAQLGNELNARPADGGIIHAAIEPLGIVYTAIDDIRDVGNAKEEHANLKAMIQKGYVDRSDAIVMLDDASNEFEANIAAAPPSFNFLDYFRDDINKCRRWLNDPAMAAL